MPILKAILALYGRRRVRERYRMEDGGGADILLFMYLRIEFLRKDLLKDREGVIVNAALINELLEIRLVEAVTVIDDDAIAKGEVIVSEKVEGGTGDRV
jgi:hypothetical protein